ncbi:hypothetical protein BV898_18494 [Hypsibius exemplaris]|uniref:Uncharacterized protein n=1 Tax=Hypsibius exemplaris TaxID=2072580 RepID=A0A9X6NIX5_HYPEX|nr:hypothetical protein BV898_18494 [Hypsibius exemplaris]
MSVGHGPPHQGPAAGRVSRSSEPHPRVHEWRIHTVQGAGFGGGQSPEAVIIATLPLEDQRRRQRRAGPRSQRWPGVRQGLVDNLGPRRMLVLGRSGKCGFLIGLYFGGGR